MSTSADDNPTAGGVADVTDIEIDRRAEVPIGVQLAWALRSRIGDGRLAPGERLPGLRDLAEIGEVNVNTVRAVYQRLEQDGLIASRQGTGTFVTATPRPPSAAAAIAASAAREALELGVDPREVAAAMYVAPQPTVAQREPGAERRRQLRAQIGALERTLGEMEARHPGAASAAESRADVSGPMLLNAEQLERVRAALVRRLAAVQQAMDASLAVEQEPATPKRIEAGARGKSAERSARPRPRPNGRTAPAT